eukprot:scaffold29496_cov64-Phaeocystis_antarctica.AAC.6
MGTGLAALGARAARAAKRLAAPAVKRLAALTATLHWASCFGRGALRCVDWCSRTVLLGRHSRAVWMDCLGGHQSTRCQWPQPAA